MNSRRLLTITLALALAALIAAPASAQDPAASCACDTKAGTLVIRYAPELSDEKPPWAETPAPVHFMELLDIDEESMIASSRSASFTCRLKSGEFEVTLEPGIPNPNLLGRCGAAITGLVTIKRNGDVILEEQEFENINCHEREKYLRTVTLKGRSPKPVLDWVPYEE